MPEHPVRSAAMRRRGTVCATAPLVAALLLATSACGGKPVTTASGAAGARQYRQAIIDDVSAIWPVFAANSTAAAASGQYAQCDDNGATYGYQAGGVIVSPDVKNPVDRLQRVTAALHARGWQDSTQSFDPNVLLRVNKGSARVVIRRTGTSLNLTGYSQCAEVSSADAAALDADDVNGTAAFNLPGVPTSLPSTEGQ